jgi:hypothetical protein
MSPQNQFLDTPLRLVTATAPRPPNFIDDYLAYTNLTECPTFFHRWTAITCLAAHLGRQVHFQHGHFTIHPNIYTMLIGSPGTKKSSAIKIGAKLMAQAGYTNFAAKKTRQEKFLLDLADQADRYLGEDLDEGGGDLLDDMLFGASSKQSGNVPDADHAKQLSRYATCPPCETFVAADEFNNFIGIGNNDFISILGELWDYDGIYDYRLKNSKSVYIPNPTVTILGGNTPTGFAQAFPTDTLGQGFFSRLLLVYGEPSGVKHTFPPAPDPVVQKSLIAKLHHIKEEVQGEMTLTAEARELMEYIYHNWEGIDDLRFEHYTNRRLTHLIKLTLVCTASRISNTIEEQDIVYANTLLSFTEHLMPKALGEFGKARNSDVTHKIVVALDKTLLPLSLNELWKAVQQDLDSRDQLNQIINNLMIAEKIQAAQGGYLPVKKALNTDRSDRTVDWTLLTDIERGLL